MTIPKEISEVHVQNAIEKMSKLGVEFYKQSTGYDLLYKDMLST